MSIAGQAIFDIPSGVGLRQELSLRNLQFASRHGYLHELSDGQVPSIIFGRDEKGRHGNFHPDAYRRICANDRWARRLEKVHTAHKRSRLRSNWRWRELDCCNSSDALLMNVFCYPNVVDRAAVRALLGIESRTVPEFGLKPRTPLQNGKRDNTEIDMKIGELLVEAKLTESNFQFANMGLISRYRDLEAVFDVSELPTRNGKQCGYQLIRGALAGYAMGCSFCVLCDARRPDLVESWYRVMRAVRPFELRCRLKLLTWQELTCVLPEDLQKFLLEKYGIFPAASSCIVSG
ncbi:MAG: hypothetical protein WA700_01560 [Acidobacteriaceae bacterium]